MKVLESDRLLVRRMAHGDARFLVELLNDPDFLRYIGDKGVRDEADARKYLDDGALRSYAERGYGMYLVETKESGDPIGMCGLIRRDGLDAVDIGFAYLPDFRGLGYGFEAGAAVLAHAHDDLGLRRVVAVTSPDNAASMALLRKMGLRFDRMIRLPGDSRDCRLFVPVLDSDI